MEPQSTATRRLVRRSHDRYIAGVAGGVADYLGVDPVIVRIAFVVLTFVGGAGAIAYAAAWLLVPEADRATSLGEDAWRQHNWARIAGFVLIAIAASIALRPLWWFGGSALTATLLILLGLYLLWHRDDRDSDGIGPHAGPGAPPAGTPPTAPAPPPTMPTVTKPTGTTPAGTEELTAPESTTTTATTATAATSAGWPPPPPPPPAFAQPPPQPHPKRQRRGRGIGTLTFALLLIGAGVVGLVLAAGRDIEATHVFAGGLLVVGGALVVSAWFGRGSGLIVLGVLLVALMSVSSLIDVPFKGGFGQRTEHPTTISNMQPEYHLAAGELIIDLHSVPFVPGTTTDVTATVATGHLVVIVPRDVEVDVHAHAGAGDIRFLGDDGHSGVQVDRDGELQSSLGAAHLDLDARVGFGQVEVRDATA